MWIFDLFFSKPKILISLDKNIFNYWEKITWEINIYSKKNINLNSILLRLEFNNDPYDWLLWFFNDYNRKIPEITIPIEFPKIWWEINVKFKIDPLDYFNEIYIKKYLEKCKNNIEYNFNDNIDVIISSFLDPQWELVCDDLNINKNILFDSSWFKDLLNNYKK